MDLITKIRKNTGILHEASEKSGIIKRIVEGTASVESYAEYLYNLNEMYKAIEGGLEKNKDNEKMKAFLTPELYKSHLIEKDLAHFLKDSTEKPEVLASTVACVERIKEVSDEKPELLVAYAYTRFMADLFGVRTFIPILGEKYSITEEGLNYYNCEGVGEIMPYVMGYAMKINNMNLSQELEEKLIVEISNAYIYNLAISQELESKFYHKKK